MFLHRCCCWTTHQRIDVATGRRVGKYDLRDGSEIANGKDAQATGVFAYPGGRWAAIGGFVGPSSSSLRLIQYGSNNRKAWQIASLAGTAIDKEVAVLSDDSTFVSVGGSPGFTNAYLYGGDGSLLTDVTSSFTTRSFFGSAVDASNIAWGVAGGSNGDLFNVDMTTLLADTLISQTGFGFKPSFDRSNGWITGGQIIYDTFNNTGVRPSEGWIGVGNGVAWKRSTSDTVLECYSQFNLTGSPIATVTAFPDSSGNKAFLTGATNSRGEIVVTSGGTNDNPQEDIENIAIFAPDGSTLLRIDSGWRTNDPETAWRRAFCNDVCWSPDESEIIIGHLACDRFERPATPP